MGKSRKAAGKRSKKDSRGYHGQSPGRTGSTAAVAKTAVAVSQQKHDGIKSLVEQLREDSQLAAHKEGSPTESGSAPSHKAKTTTTTTTLSSDRFISKLTGIVDRLLELGFTEGHLDLVVQHLGYAITLESALDYLCLHVPTLELPPLFTDGQLRDNLRTNGGGTGGSSSSDNNSLTVLKFAARPQQQEQPSIYLSEDIIARESVDGRISAKPNSSEENRVQSSSIAANSKRQKQQEEEEKEAADQKAWLLQMYADCHDDDDNDDDDGKWETDQLNQEQYVQSQNQQLSPDEKELVEKEQKFQELQDDVNNEANNYMRSKAEIKQLKHQCNMMKKDIAGLRRKIERVQREKEAAKASIKEDEEEIETSSHANLFGIWEEGDDSEDSGGNIFDLFGDNIDSSSAATIAGTEPNGGVVEVVQTQLVAKSHIECPIPKGWTGTTPQKTLEDVCKKKKLGRPKFSRMPNKSGRRLAVTTTKRGTPTEWAAQQTDFSNDSSLTDYLSLQALYAIDSTVPVYRLFPPAFRTIWLSWLAQVQLANDALKDGEKQVKSERIERLTSLISVHSQPGGVSAAEATEENPKLLSKTIMLSVDDSWDDVHDMNQSTQTIESSRSGTTMKDEFIHRQASNGYKNMLDQRSGLPMTSFRQNFLQTVGGNSVTILCAETGAGKTTQCPQYILEDALLQGQGDSVNIVCTQPRRVAATSVAERVAEEMCDRLGNQVGYQIRMESKKSAKTRLLFCTTGVILRRLQEDKDLQSISHVVVDEVHERQVEVDILLIALRHILRTSRKDLKVILMSASIDPSLFSNFFGRAPVIQVPGRTFPVSNFFLEDLVDATGYIIEEGSPYAIRDGHHSNNKTTLWVTRRGGEKRRETLDMPSSVLDADSLSNEYIGYSLSTRLSMERVNETVINYDLIEDVLEHLLVYPERNQTLKPPEGAPTTGGAILIFLPGLGEIKSLADRISANRKLADSSRFSVIPLHSKLSSLEQRRAFLPAKFGCRKIILSTNIAETSVTIPDVVVVIDSGRERELRRNQRTSSSMLVTDWCSKASAKQRAGRAGRVQSGICLKLYSSATAQSMKWSADPELKRAPLEEVCLMILSLGRFGDCQSFLRQAPQPPSEDAIQSALLVLEEVGAIASDRKSLTPLGLHLAKLPVDVRLGKMLVLGAMFNCLDSSLTIAASLSCKSPFATYFEDATLAKARHALFQDAESGSDFVTLCNVWEGYNKARSKSTSSGRAFCKTNYLDHNVLHEVSSARREFLNLLSGIGFVPKETVTAFGTAAWEKCSVNQNASMWSVVHAVVCAGLSPNFARLSSDGSTLRLIQKEQDIFFHKSSLNAGKKRFRSDQQWVAFHGKFATPGRVSVSSTCFVSPLPLILFGKSLRVEHIKRMVVVDDWIEIAMPAQTAVTLVQLRRQIDSLLERLVRDTNLVDTSIMDEIVDILQ